MAVGKPEPRAWWPGEQNPFRPKLDDADRQVARQLRKLARAAEYGEVWSPADGLLASQLVQGIRGAAAEKRPVEKVLPGRSC